MKTFEECKSFRFSGVANELAHSLPRLSAIDRLSGLLTHFGRKSIVTTSFGPTSALLLDLATQVCPGVRVLNVRHGHETPETLDFMDLCKQRFDFELQVVQAPRLPVPEAGSAAFDRFQQVTKVKPLREALSELGVWFWLSGVMHDEHGSRESLEMARVRYGTIAVYPVLDWSFKNAMDYCLERDLPINSNYRDPCKGIDQSLECGLHFDHSLNVEGVLAST